MGLTTPCHISEQLQTLFQQMQQVAEHMHTIIQDEQQALQHFNAEHLTELVERRARSQSTLAELESQCQRLLQAHHAPRNMRLEDFINQYIPGDQAALQAQRLQLSEYLQRIQNMLENNRIRLHAAWRVTSHVLQEIGALPKPDSYSMGGYAQASSGTR